jgi:threonine/homoserine efflux transporter RhtA
VRRAIGFILATSLTAVGGLWLLLQIFRPDQTFGTPLMGFCLLFAVGAYWFWANYIASGEE